MKQKIFFTILVIILLKGNLIFAQETPYRLDDIVVTASRIETPLKEAPANITVITSEEMEQKGVATLIDVFKEEPGLSTKSFTGTIKQSNVDIRGYGEAAPQNVLFLIDGRRVNNVDMSGADLAQIPVAMIERVEIYRGSATVMFGDNASAGAVNIILKKGEGKPKVTAKMLGGSYNLFAPSLSVSGSDKRFSYFLLSSSYDTDGYRENQGVQMKDVFGNFSVDPLKNLTINIKTGYHKDRYGMPGPVLWQNLISGTAKRTDASTPFDNASTEDSFFDMEADIKLAEDVKFLIGGSYRNRHSASYFDYGTFGFNESKGQLETYGFTPRIVIDKPLYHLKNTFTMGFDYYKSPTATNWSGAFFGFPSHTIADIDKTDYGIYVNERIYPLSNLTLDIGYRVHKAAYDSKYTDYVTPALSTAYRTHEQKEAFRASVNYAFSKTGNAFITYAKGFRFPTTDELVNIQTGAITTNLNPQTGWEVNIGARWNPFKRLGGSLTLFQSKNKDEIFYNPYTFTNANYERTKRQGVETQLNFIVTENLKFGVGYSYIDVKFDGKQLVGGIDIDGNSIPLVPKNKFSANISYSFNSFIINFITVYTGNMYAISDQLNNHRELPGYTTCDMNISYKYKNLEALFGIKNLTGKEYSEFGVASTTSARINLYPSPERQYFLRLAYTFGG
jgi:iron complex outermembrane receptor protein